MKATHSLKKKWVFQEDHEYGAGSHVILHSRKGEGPPRVQFIGRKAKKLWCAAIYDLRPDMVLEPIEAIVVY